VPLALGPHPGGPAVKHGIPDPPCVGPAAHGTHCTWDMGTPWASRAGAPHTGGLGSGLLPRAGAKSASEEALAELCDEGSKLPSEKRM